MPTTYKHRKTKNATRKPNNGLTQRVKASKKGRKPVAVTLWKPETILNLFRVD